MYKELISHLAFVYGFVCRGRGKVPEDEMRAVANSAHVMVRRAPAVLGGEDETGEDRKDLALAGEMERHIEEAVVFLQNMEIV